MLLSSMSLSIMTSCKELCSLSPKIVRPFCHACNYNSKLFLGKSLLWVAILLLAVLYCYAVISFIFLRDKISDLANENLFCGRLDECFISVLRFGLIDSFLVTIQSC